MNTRYHYCPQLEIYDKVGFKWIPHLMFMNSPNYRTEVCNTDIYGFRFNSKKNLNSEQKSIFDIKIEKEKSLMVGSSTTFGVGATCDEKTIPGILSSKSKYFFYNFGGRAFNGLQEIILTELMINKVNDVKKILLYSGMNDVYMSYNESFIPTYPGPFYFNSDFLSKMEDSTLSLKKRMLKFLFPNSKNKKKHDTNFFFPKIELEEIISRNIKLWELFSKSINSEISFFLPPFLPWSKNKSNYTKEEEEISAYIKFTGGVKNTTYFDEIEKDYKKIVKLFEENCKKNKIKFYDCNILFQSNKYNSKWLFVDKTHLTDYGNELISEYMLGKL